MDSSRLPVVVREAPLVTLFLVAVAFGAVALVAAYGCLHAFAPKPRPPLPSEKQYQTTTADGRVVTRPLPCWHDRWLAERHESEAQADKDGQPGGGGFGPSTGAIEPAQLRMSVVMPAYNEEKRILPALEDAVAYLDATFGREAHGHGDDDSTKQQQPPTTTMPAVASPTFAGWLPRRSHSPAPMSAGYEIIIVDDGSRDGTQQVILEFARKHGLHDTLRLVTLARNRGKGGAVTHGLRHVRGEYALFADADGASRFADLGKLLEGCADVADAGGRGVAIGSRGHLVGSAAVVRRSALRNFLMRGFHFVLMILTPPATSRVRDTQCGFKLFSRAALPHIVPYMHAEGWIFDIEMLMLAESAPAVPVLASDGTVIGRVPGIKVAEVPIDWHEVDGSKLNVIQDSIRMAVGLAVLRASWMLGVYRRRLT